MVRLSQGHDFFFFFFVPPPELVDKAAGDQTSVGAGFEESDLLDSPFLPSILSLQLHPEKNMTIMRWRRGEGRSE